MGPARECAWHVRRDCKSRTFPLLVVYYEFLELITDCHQIIFFAGVAYFIFKLVRIWSGERVYQYKPVAKPLTTFAALTIPLILATIGVAIAVTLNFGKGLKPHLTGRAGESEEEDKHYMNEMPHHVQGPAPTRMTIE